MIIRTALLLASAALTACGPEADFADAQSTGLGAAEFVSPGSARRQPPGPCEMPRLDFDFEPQPQPQLDFEAWLDSQPESAHDGRIDLQVSAGLIAPEYILPRVGAVELHLEPITCANGFRVASEPSTLVLAPNAARAGVSLDVATGCYRIKARLLDQEIQPMPTCEREVEVVLAAIEDLEVAAQDVTLMVACD